ncbi:MAG: hypothetical protein Q7T33_04150 [Dehalococcoidia bacterium]|nr:hypothetical protein [Dehalococcoidia bacterium]
MKEFTRARAGDRLGDRASQALNGTITRLDRIHVLAVVLALGLTAFLAIEPTQNWLLLLLAGLAGLGTDGIVRTHPKAQFKRLDDTALFLFVPVLFTLGLGLMLEDVARGHWTIAAGLLSAGPYWAILHAEYASVDRKAPHFQLTRLVLNVATYVIAFLFFATIYDFELSLVTTSFAAGIVSILLAIEVLREEGMETGRTILYALAIGVLLAEAAWATHFLPLEGSAAAVFLLLALYLMTGMMHNYLANRLTLRTASEFTLVALAGVLIIALNGVSF